MSDPIRHTTNTRSKNTAQAEIFANRLRKRYKHLAKWARREGTGVFRLYDRDIPEIPLVLDYYEGTVPAGFRRNPSPSEDVRALFGALYKRPYEKNIDEEALWLSAMRNAAVSAIPGITADRIFLKERRREKGGSVYGRSEQTSFPLDIREGGFIFRVNLSRNIDTGIFPDSRRVRSEIFHRASGKSVLNLFCYTGAFSVMAAAGGARKVDSVDLSAEYLRRAEENAKLNGIPTGDNYCLIRADALEFPDTRNSEKWDIIILNPPAFSNSKRSRFILDLKRDYNLLIEKCLRILSPYGSLYFGTHLHGIKFDSNFIKTNSMRYPGLLVENITERCRCEDFIKHHIPSWYIFSKSFSTEKPQRTGSPLV